MQGTFGTTVSIADLVSQVSSEEAMCECHEKSANSGQIYIGVNKMDSGTAGSEQEKCDEISNEMKSMLIKICWTKDFIEKNTQTAEAGAVGATKCSQNSYSSSRGVSVLTSRESRIVDRHETRTRAMQ